MPNIISNGMDRFVDDFYEGVMELNKDHIVKLDGVRAFGRKMKKEEGKVKLVGIGGAGHESYMWGQNLRPYGMDYKIVGEMFTSPSSQEILKVLCMIDDHSPIILMLNNHYQDRVNADLACDVARKRGIDIHQVVIYDDIASAPKGMEKERRGLMTSANLVEIIGPAAEMGEPVETVLCLAEKVIANSGSYGIGFSGTYNPITGTNTFSLKEGEVSYGVGVHGERSGVKGETMDSCGYARHIFQVFDEDKDLSGKDVLLIVNGMGGTTYQELVILFRDLKRQCDEHGVQICDAQVGELGTTFDMQGVIVTMTILDQALRAYWRRKRP